MSSSLMVTPSLTSAFMTTCSWVGAASGMTGVQTTRGTPAPRRDAALLVLEKTCQGREAGCLPDPFKQRSAKLRTFASGMEGVSGVDDEEDGLALPRSYGGRMGIRGAGWKSAVHRVAGSRQIKHRAGMQLTLSVFPRHVAAMPPRSSMR